ncbi:MAG: glycosyltransferase family 4 protein [Methylococcales bacterium]
MKNILFIVPSLRRAGAETQIIDLVNHLDENKFNLHLLSFSPIQDQLDRIDTTKVTYHHVLRKHKFHLGFISEIRKVISENKIDLIHCTLQFSLLIGWLASLFSSRKPAFIDVMHTTVNRGKKEDMQDFFIYQWLMRKCKEIIFVCNNQRLYWEGKFPFIEKKSSVIYNGVDEAFFCPEDWVESGRALRESLNIPKSSCVLACIAGFRKEKGHHFLIEALSQSPQSIHLLLAGDGELKTTIVEMVAKKGLTERVHFLGMLNEVRPVISAANATVLTSTAVETFSIAMLESMSMATPMIASNIGGMAEAIDKNTGWLLEPADVTRLSEIMSTIVLNPELAVTAGEHAREKVIELFSMSSMATQTESILEDILKS